MDKMMKCAGKEDTLTMRAEDDGNTVAFLFEAGSELSFGVGEGAWGGGGGGGGGRQEHAPFCIPSLLLLCSSCAQDQSAVSACQFIEAGGHRRRSHALARRTARCSPLAAATDQSLARPILSALPFPPSLPQIRRG